MRWFSSLTLELGVALPCISHESTTHHLPSIYFRDCIVQLALVDLMSASTKFRLAESRAYIMERGCVNVSDI